VQSLTVPSGAHNPNGHTTATITRALHGVDGTRHFDFRYELLSSANAYLGDLDDVLGGEIEQNWLADVKRTARFEVLDTGEINYLQDRIKPWARLSLPPYGTDDWVEWPQGVFGLVSPTRHADATDTVIRSVDGWDMLQTYADDKIAERYTVTAGTAYTTAVATLLDTTWQIITVSASTLPVDREWEPGTPKLRIINDLLGAINYESLSFDEHGYAIVQPYVAPSTRGEEYVYADDETSVILPEVDQTVDLFGVANSWTLVVSDPDRAALTSSYTNSDPASPTSTVSRQRTITDFRTEQDAADQDALDAKVARLAFEASQVYEVIEFETGIMPIHSGNDVYRLRYGPLSIDAKYSEHAWTMPLAADATMKHTVRRVVSA
jgi:hypothetical protein